MGGGLWDNFLIRSPDTFRVTVVLIFVANFTLASVARRVALYSIKPETYENETWRLNYVWKCHILPKLFWLLINLFHFVKYLCQWPFCHKFESIQEHIICSIFTYRVTGSTKCNEIFIAKMSNIPHDYWHQFKIWNGKWTFLAKWRPFWNVLLQIGGKLVCICLLNIPWIELFKTREFKLVAVTDKAHWQGQKNPTFHAEARLHSANCKMVMTNTTLCLSQ